MDSSDNKETKVIHEVRKLCLKDSVINSLPTIFSCFLWIAILFLGVEALVNSLQQEFQGLAVIVWMLVCMNLTKIIISPKTVYHVERGYYEDEN